MSPRPYKIALNGYGRIGRCVLRALHERGAGSAIEIVALNDLADQASIEYLTRFDSTHGRFPGVVAVDGDWSAYQRRLREGAAPEHARGRRLGRPGR